MEKFDSLLKALTFRNHLYRIRKGKQLDTIIQTPVYSVYTFVIPYLFYIYTFIIYYFIFPALGTLKFQEKRAKMVNISCKKLRNVGNFEVHI